MSNFLPLILSVSLFFKGGENRTVPESLRPVDSLRGRQSTIGRGNDNRRIRRRGDRPRGWLESAREERVECLGLSGEVIRHIQDIDLGPARAARQEEAHRCR